MTRVGIIGLGQMGKRHMRILQEMPDVDLVGIADPYLNLEGMPPIKDDHPVAVYKSALDLIKDALQPGDAVIIAAPTSEHYRLATEAWRAGLSVLVEKPMTETYMEAVELAVGAVHQSQILMVGYVEVFNPAVAKLRECLLTWGVKPLLVEVRRSGLANLHPVAGVTGELATHDFAVLHYLFGRPSFWSGKVGAVLNGHECFVVATLRYYGPRQLTALVSADWLSPAKVRKLRVVCREGTFYLDYIAQHLSWHPIGLEPEVVEVVEAEPLKLELEHFFACIDTGQRPLTDGPLGLDVARLVSSIVGEKEDV